jgi:hypothetical protein
VQYDPSSEADQDAIVPSSGRVRALITFEVLSIAMTVGEKLSAP